MRRAVSKHGTLHAAYSNPRLRVLLEEWGRLRPNQAGISAWTLNSHLKKFDNLKRQLVEDQEEERRIKEARAVYHHNTDIPVYDLGQLSAMVKLPASVRMLVSTRQRALQRGDTDKQFSYLELWAKQWELETGDLVKGKELQNRLHQLQARPSVRHRLKQVMVTQTTEVIMSEKEEEQEIIDLDSFEFEVPAVGFRNTVFPRVDEQALDILVRRKVKDDDYKENWLETLGHSRLGLLMVADLKEIVDEDGIKFKSKLSYLNPEDDMLIIQGDPTQDCLYSCPQPLCTSQFQNYNNFLFHLSVHKNTAGLGEQKQTFGQKMESYRICTDLVMECLD